MTLRITDSRVARVEGDLTGEDVAAFAAFVGGRAASLVLDLSDRIRLTTALYDYRQLDSPRTDLCPPPYAPRSDASSEA